MFYNEIQESHLWKLYIGMSVGIIGYIMLKSKDYINQNYKRSISNYSLTIFGSSICVIMSIPLVPIAFFILWLYRQYVTYTLKIKHGELFGGLLDGTDVVWTAEKKSRLIINALVFVEYDSREKDFLEAIKLLLKEKIFTKGRKNSKLLCVLQRSQSYLFLLRNQVTIDECIKVIKIKTADPKEMSKKELDDYISQICISSLPKEDTALWEVHVGNQPVKWHDDNENEAKTKPLYPLVFRLHHCLLDGSSTLKFFVSLLGKNESNGKLYLPNQSHCNENNNFCSLLNEKLTEITKSLNLNFKDVSNKFKEAVQIVKSVLEDLKFIIWIIPSLIVLATRKDDCNILNKPNSLTGCQKVAWFTEETTKYVSMIREIKTKIQGTTFTDVILTAIASSVENYFREHSENIPEEIMSAVTIIPNIPELSHIKPGKYDVEEVVPENTFSLIVVKLPMSKCQLRDKLLKIKGNYSKAKKSVEPRVNYWIMAYLAKYLPFLILEKLLELSVRSTTVLISNLPGPKAFSFATDMFVKDLILWAPLQYNIGVSFAVLTYDKRLQMGLMIDKSLLISEHDTQKILNNILKAIDTLYEEITSAGNLSEKIN